MSDKRRSTWQREAVREALSQEPGFVSAQALHAQLQTSARPIGLATVYRALSALAEDGDADSLLSDDGVEVYRACVTDAHHHHLMCRSCGRTVELTGAPVERWAEEVAAEHGFTAVTHQLDLFGLCADCSRR